MTLHRVLRIVEYVGEPEWVEASLQQRAIKGRVEFPRGYIQEAVVGDTAEVLEYAALEQAAANLVEKAVCPGCRGGALLDPRDCKVCSGTGIADGSGPWPESAKEQGTARREIARAERGMKK